MSTKTKILVIEDNLDVRENISEILSLSGYDTLEAEDGTVGVKLARDHHPDLIICDVMMPKLDGFGVLRILNCDPQLMHIPFMFLTALTEKGDFRKGMGLGADDYITKPFDEVELLDAIEIRLKKSAVIKSVTVDEQGIRQLYDSSRGDAELLQLSEDREVRRYGAKEKLYTEGQHPRYIHLIKKGKVKVYRQNEQGKELISQLLSVGDWMGYLPVLQNTLYTDNAEVMEEAEVLLIPVSDFRSLLYNNRDVSARLLEMLADRTNHDENMLLELAYSSVRHKVAMALLGIAEKDGLTISINREDLASLAGTAKESTIRMLSDFKSEGILTTDASGVITIDDLDSLRAMHQ